MDLPQSRSAMAKHCLFLVICVLLAGHAIVERLSGQVVTGQVIDSTSSVTIVVSYRARMTYQSRRTCASLTARSGDIVQSIGIRLNIHVRDTVTIPWHPEGIVFQWKVTRCSTVGHQRRYIPGYYDMNWNPVISGSTIVSTIARRRVNCGPGRERRSMRVYIEPGHAFLLQCPQDLTLASISEPP
jgi:hypothetical protein